eukprot:c21350_g1_i2 orf=235-1122(-)
MCSNSTANTAMPKSGKTLEEVMNVKVVGKGSEALVLAHGFGGTQAHWEALVPLLINEKSYRVILIDWPGACTTDVDDFDTSVFDCKSLYTGFAHMLIDLLQDELHIHSCTFVGHSMSAMIGCIAALTHPSLFKKLILVGASPRYLNDRDYYGGFEREDLDQLYEAMATDFEGWAVGFAAAVVGAEAEQDAIDVFTRTLSSMRPEVALAMAKGIFESDFRSVIEEMKQVTGDGSIEVHVLQTCKDLAVPLLVSDYLKSHLDSNGCLEILQTDGHVPQLSAPDLFLSALLRHLSPLS